MSLKTTHKLAVCCLNISEGRNSKLIDDIAFAAVRNQEQWQKKETSSPTPFKCNSTVLSVYSDSVFNRGNITIASTVEYLPISVYQACEIAFDRINLETHVDPPGHPRLGVVDLIPVHPISISTSLEECSHVAHRIAESITQNISDSSIFYFGKADHSNRDLVQRRKEMNWFAQYPSDIVATPDLGKFTSRLGVTAVGAIPYMSVLNVLLDTSDFEYGKFIASNIRERNKKTGMKGIQAMAFMKGSKVEIACNIDTNALQSEVSKILFGISLRI